MVIVEKVDRTVICDLCGLQHEDTVRRADLHILPIGWQRTGDPAPAAEHVCRKCSLALDTPVKRERFQSR